MGQNTGTKYTSGVAAKYVFGKTMADYVTDNLRMDIVQKRIPAESVITVKEIAERYGVSLMPVRDAFHTLKGERFLDVTPYKNVRVLKIDKNYVRNIYDITTALECLLAQDLIPNGTSDIFSKMETINNELRHLWKIGESVPEKYLALNSEFHAVMYAPSGNDIAKERLHYYSDTILNSLRIEYRLNKERLQEMISEHDQIIAAAKRGNQADLQECLRLHCINARDDFLKNEI